MSDGANPNRHGVERLSIADDEHLETATDGVGLNGPWAPGFNKIDSEEAGDAVDLPGLPAGQYCSGEGNVRGAREPFSHRRGQRK